LPPVKMITRYHLERVTCYQRITSINAVMA
jgi:hypothetical protein